MEKVYECWENKEEIMKFIFEHWKTIPSVMFGNKEVYLAHGRECHLFCSIGNAVDVVPVLQLTSDHEEADTRMLLHTYHAAQNGFENIVIRTPDTDVFVIAIYASLSFASNIIFLTGTGNNRRMISINSIKEQLGDSLCDALPGFHAFTGKDT